MYTNLGLVDHAKQALNDGWGYVYGTWGNVCTESLLQQKKAQYPANVVQFEDFIRTHWMGRVVADCVGLIKSYYWEQTDGTRKYDGNTDVSANGMYSKASEKGDIGSIPEIPGLCVQKDGHIGVYIGNGEVIESRGTKAGVIKSTLTSNNPGWQHWLKCPFIQYVEDSAKVEDNRTIKGIDVSHYDGEIDFAKVKADGVEVVIMKASEATDYKDPTFVTNYNNVVANGLKTGVYHFLRPNNTDDEINNFLSAIGDRKFDCKLFIDMETNFGGIEINSKKTRDFADALISKGYEVALYSGEYFYNHSLDDSVKDLPIWVAKYSQNKPNVLNYIGWQYSDSGQVNGINHAVDMNYFSNGIFVGHNTESQGQNSEASQPTPRDTAQDALSTKVKRAKEYFKGNVLELQRNLNKVMGTHIAEDNLFGSQTYGLIIAFQTKYGLEVDGLFGTNSTNKLNSLLSEMNKPKPSSGYDFRSLQGYIGAKQDNIPGNETLGKCPTVKFGSSGSVVKWMQARLNYLGFNCGYADGKFGKLTLNAVKSLQNNRGLSSDGIVGQNTWRKLLGL